MLNSKQKLVEKKDDKKPAQQQQQQKKKETPAAAEEEEKVEAFQGFDFETFKRVYSNEDEAKSIPYFWEKFNEHGDCSIWYGEYKYNNELSKVFMSCNLITGMFQRLDKMRKNAFASVCLFGEDDNSSISGIWIWRGQDLLFTQSPDWQIDYDCYEWKKLDATSTETKNLVQQYLSWNGADKQGRKFNQGKIFK